MDIEIFTNRFDFEKRGHWNARIANNLESRELLLI
jgi:hypothetical protein